MFPSSSDSGSDQSSKSPSGPHSESKSSSVSSIFSRKQSSSSGKRVDKLRFSRFRGNQPMYAVWGFAKHKKIKRRRKFGQETFETCLETKANDVVQLQPIRFWKYIRGILKVMSFLFSPPDKLSFFRGY